MAALVKTLGPATDVRLVETLSPCFVMVHTSALRRATRARTEDGHSVGEEVAGFAGTHIPSYVVTHTLPA